MKKFYTLSFILLASLSFGQILSDDFNYADNALLTANGWTGFSGTGTQPVDVGVSNGLTYAGYSGVTGFTAAAEGNAARLDNTGEDIQKTFTAITSGSIYYSFLINVDALNAATGYCIGLTTTGTTFGNKFFVRPSSTAGKINFGISNTTTANYSTDFNPGTTYLIIVKYDVSATGSYSMWIKSSGVPATEVAAGTPDVTGSGSGSATIGGFFLRQHTASENLTIDGLRMYSTWFNTTPCDLTLGAESSVCDASTLSLDTYTVTIPFTGGNTASYTLNTNFGTIGGDNPNSVASGNITITGITENTNITFTVSGGCDIVKNFLSPECKPVNTLPYTEHFNYTVGNSLGAEQMWTNVNTGDNVLAVAGNLAYTGITPSGNSVSFSGAGIETFSPFTTTTSGTVYYSFLMNITDMANVTTDLTETYFAGLTDNAKSYMGRLFVKKNGTQYQLGFDSESTTTNYDATLRAVGDVVLVVMGYDFTANKLSAWFNPDLTTFTAATPATLTNTPAVAIANLGGFILRQEDTAKTPTITIDELNISLTTPSLSVKQNEISGLNIYPNPVTKGTLYITSNSNSTKSVSIFDVLGRQVLNTKVSNNTVNVSNLKGGAYIVKINEEGKTATRKLIIE
jgi:hypothetical protein